MDVAKMRDKISSVYPYEKWTEKVKWMADNQVIAIYFSFLDKGMFDKKPPVQINYIQMSIADLIAEKEKEKRNEQ